MAGSDEMPANINDCNVSNGAGERAVPARSTLEVVIAGTARDCAPHLPDVLRSITRLGERFRKATYIVAENDSRDATRAILDKWMSERGGCGFLVDPTGPDISSPHRTVRIAGCRNAILDRVRERHAGADILILLDMDEPNRELDADAVMRAVAYLDARKQLAAVFANSTPVYFDLFALRHPVWCPNDCWGEARANTGRLGANEAVRVFVSSRMLRIDPAAPPFPVDSAFGALGIYRIADALAGRYQGVEADGNFIASTSRFTDRSPRQRGMASRYCRGCS